MSNFESVAAADWQTWIDANHGIVLDVREPDEWALGTLPDALLMSQGDIVERMDELEKSTPVLCVCKSGGRSSTVAMFLSYNGYTVANLDGGMSALGMQD